MKSNYIYGIRARFIAAFLISIFAGLFVFLIVNEAFRDKRTDYSREIAAFNRQCQPIIESISASLSNRATLQNIVSGNHPNYGDLEIYITDKDGNVLLSSPQNPVSKLNLIPIIESQGNYSYPGNSIRYTRLESLPGSNFAVISSTIVKSDELGLGVVGIAVFILTFFVLTYSRVGYINVLADALKEIANGNQKSKVKIIGKDELTLVAENINLMVDELNFRRQREEQVEKAKNELVVNMSHDLRTPLTSVIGYVQLLKNRYAAEDEIKAYIDIIDEKSKRLETMIQDLFEFTALASCEVILQKTHVSLNELVRQVVEGMLTFGIQNGITIVYQAPTDQLMVHVDTGKLVRVFENLIENAVKYSDKPGTVEVSLCREGEKALVRISNKGTILNNETARLFERFYRTDEARNSQTGGTGIGLSIARSIIELHNGEISAMCTNETVFFTIVLAIDT